MQNITRIALGLGAAAVVASGGSAFTAGLTTTAVNSDSLSYGSFTANGVIVSNVVYNRASQTNLSDIVITIDRDVTVGHTSILRLSGGGSPAENASCTPAFASGEGTLTCTTSRLIADTVTLQLNVTPTS